MLKKERNFHYSFLYADMSSLVKGIELGDPDCDFGRKADEKVYAYMHAYMLR